MVAGKRIVEKTVPNNSPFPWNNGGSVIRPASTIIPIGPPTSSFPGIVPIQPGAGGDGSSVDLFGPPDSGFINIGGGDWGMPGDPGVGPGSNLWGEQWGEFGGPRPTGPIGVSPPTDPEEIDLTNQFPPGWQHEGNEWVDTKPLPREETGTNWGTIIGGAIAIAGGIAQALNNISSGWLNCEDIIAQGTSALSALGVGAHGLQSQVQNSLNALKPPPHNDANGKPLSPECQALTDAIIQELQDLLNQINDLIDVINALMATLVNYDCMSGANSAAFAGGSSGLSGLGNSIAANIQALINALADLNDQYQSLLAELADALGGQCGPKPGPRRRCPRGMFPVVKANASGLQAQVVCLPVHSTGINPNFP